MSELKERFYDIVWNLQDKVRDPRNALKVGAIGGFVIGLALGYLGRL